MSQRDQAQEVILRDPAVLVIITDGPDGLLNVSAERLQETQVLGPVREAHLEELLHLTIIALQKTNKKGN